MKTRTHTEPYAAAIEVCADPVKHGHFSRYRGERMEGEKTPEQRAAAAAERQHTIAANRAWRSARKVRVAWLQTFLTRPKPPKGAALFIGTSLVSHGHALRRQMESNHRYLHELLGLQKPDYTTKGKQVQDLLDNASENRAQVLTVGMLLAAYEFAMPADAWRSKDQDHPRYLRYLESQGYELSPVERLACGEQVELDTDPPSALDVPEDDPLAQAPVLVEQHPDLGMPVVTRAGGVPVAELDADGESHLLTHGHGHDAATVLAAYRDHAERSWGEPLGDGTLDERWVTVGRDGVEPVLLPADPDQPDAVPVTYWQPGSTTRTPDPDGAEE
ncbi:hypothetical protein JNW90_10490 [Micromonospora sp. STR1s_5]|nr:hypothetical protein [Micromonospora sp. STR1s_5]